MNDANFWMALRQRGPEAEPLNEATYLADLSISLRQMETGPSIRAFESWLLGLAADQSPALTLPARVRLLGEDLVAWPLPSSEERTPAELDRQGQAILDCVHRAYEEVEGLPWDIDNQPRDRVRRRTRPWLSMWTDAPGVNPEQSIELRLTDYSDAVRDIVEAIAPWELAGPKPWDLADTAWVGWWNATMGPYTRATGWIGFRSVASPRCTVRRRPQAHEVDFTLTVNLDTFSHVPPTTLAREHITFGLNALARKLDMSEPPGLAPSR